MQGSRAHADFLEPRTGSLGPFPCPVYTFLQSLECLSGPQTSAKAPGSQRPCAAWLDVSINGVPHQCSGLYESVTPEYVFVLMISKAAVARATAPYSPCLERLLQTVYHRVTGSMSAQEMSTGEYTVLFHDALASLEALEQ